MWYIFVIVKPINRGTFTSPGGKGGGENVNKYKRGGEEDKLKKKYNVNLPKSFPQDFFSWCSARKYCRVL